MAMTRYDGGRQEGKRLPGPVQEISPSNEHAVQNEVLGEKSIRLQTQVEMENVQEAVEQVGMGASGPVQ